LNDWKRSTISFGSAVEENIKVSAAHLSAVLLKNLIQ
jgi:hypothetical protein